MNEHDPFEQRLRRQPLRPVPAAWRNEVLSQARATTEAKRQNGVTETAAEDQAAWIAGWRLIFRRLPLAWASLAALWIALIGVNLMLPSPIVSVAAPNPVSVRLADLAALDSSVVEIDPAGVPVAPVPEAVPATKPSNLPLQPRSERRRGLDFGEASLDSLFDNLV